MKVVKRWFIVPEGKALVMAKNYPVKNHEQGCEQLRWRVFCTKRQLHSAATLCRLNEINDVAEAPPRERHPMHGAL